MSANDRHAGTKPKTSFPIVALCASAGGLEAYTKLLEKLPADSGMAYIVIQHLDPKQPSMLPELLARATRMPVAHAQDGKAVAANRVYVIPPNKNLVIQDGRLKLAPRGKGEGLRMPADSFLRSLAADRGKHGIGVILSGTGSDGALGIAALKAAGGITLAQDEASAKYDGMPQSAVATGCVDFVLPPERLAAELARIAKHPYSRLPDSVERIATESEQQQLKTIFQLLRAARGVDFSQYKLSTLRRRIARRMALHHLEDLAAYTLFLQQNAEEARALYQDLLIKVTGFFREPESFEVLAQTVLPRLMNDRAKNEPLRIWVPGCATGEEVYSIAICLMEALDGKAAPAIQIFGSDVSEEALDKARGGIYVENIALDVPPARLKRFFKEVERGYQINKEIRELCVFARQNVFRDPPFSKLDLISCRNLLIYFSPALQKLVLPVFHFALKPRGLLMLGPSEAVSNVQELFTPLPGKHRVYAKQDAATGAPLSFSTEYRGENERLRAAFTPGAAAPGTTAGELDLVREADRLMLSSYAPASILVNERLQAVQFRGATGPYLEHAPGTASFDLFKLLREGLLGPVQGLIKQVQKDGAAAARLNVPMRTVAGTRRVNVQVLPVRVPGSGALYFLAVFEHSAGKSRAPRTRKVLPRQERRTAAERREAALEQELASTKAYLQATIETHEAANEELKSASEEILSSNEELQSTNEELLTAQEELQSTNEELITLNEEAATRNRELAQANSDLNNLIVSGDLPIVMLGADGRIRRYTPPAAQLLNLIATDVGRPISHLKPRFDLPDLPQTLKQVLDTAQMHERTVQDEDGRWYRMRVYPYRTAENRIDGAVLTWADIHALKLAKDFANTLVDSLPIPLALLDSQLLIQSVNDSFRAAFKLDDEHLQKRSIDGLMKCLGDSPPLRPLLGQVASGQTPLLQHEVECELPGGYQTRMVLNAYAIQQDKPAVQGAAAIVVNLIDVGAIHHVQQVEGSLKQKETLLKEIHHRVKNNLQVISSLLALQSVGIEDPKAVRRLEDSQERIRSMALIHEKLYKSRDLAHIDMRDYVQSLAADLAHLYGVAAGTVTVAVNVDDVHLDIDAAIPSGLILNELLSNIYKYAFPDKRRGHVGIGLGADGAGRLALTVEDDGVGLPPGLDVQKAQSLGLLIVRSLTEQLAGSLAHEPGAGTKFTVRFPEFQGKTAA